MIDVTVKVLEEATSQSFLSLAEAKMLLGLPATGATPEADALLELQIEIASATIMRLCNRMFAKTKIEETWRGNTHDVIYLRLWPVEDDDVLGIQAGNLPSIWPPAAPPAFDLENHSGKLRVNGFAGDPLTIIYSGGYLLPDDTPPDLKQACVLMISQQRKEEARASVEGIRSISHKESRVMFFDPNQAAKTTGTALAGSSGIPTVDALLWHYIRHWV